MNKLLKQIHLILNFFYFYFLLKKNFLISSEDEFKNLHLYVNKNDTVIDIGANIGRYSFELAKIVGDNGSVFSIEPMSRSFSILLYLIQFSNTKNIIPFNFAISNKTRKINMNEASNKIYKNSLFSTFTESKIVKNKTKKSNVHYSLKLDDLKIKEKITFIKIDCENHEMQVLIGGLNLIKKNRPTVLVENNKNYKKIYKFFKKINYHPVKTNKPSRNTIFISK